jgi:hypothetical protein
MPLKDLQVIMASDLSPAEIEQIRKAFFPELDDVDALLHIVYRPWSNGGQVPDLTQVVGKNARMPYNIAANIIDSPALGTQAKPPGICELRGLSHQWEMWQTASRSCVIRLDSVGDREPVPVAQNFHRAGPIAVLWDFLAERRVESINDNPFNHQNMYDSGDEILPKYFSVKTGS